jgi:penicillin-insensitive murein endopeptidase
VRRLALLSLLLVSCAGRGLLTDGTSVSVGTFNRGLLRRGHALPLKGDGYTIPNLWRQRDARYGTDELTSAIIAAARRVRREYPGGTLGIGDLSPRGGGDSKLHRSHENGRDADLIYYALDAKDKPIAPVDSMPRYLGPDLSAHDPAPTDGVTFGPYTPRHFDVKRNWALVRALLEDPHIEVQFLFCNEKLKERMLDYAQSIGEDPDLLDRAANLLHQPGDSLPHDDHLHLRIYCSADDRPYGCVDRGPVRWWKKRYKYMPPARDVPLDEILAKLAFSPYFPGARYIP